MKIVILDVDQGHNKRISLCLAGDGRNSLNFSDNLESCLETLNGSPQIEKAKKDLEESIAATNVVLVKASEAIKNLEQKRQDKAKEGESVLKSGATNAVEAAKKMAAELKEIQAKIQSEQDVSKRLTEVVAQKTTELAKISEQILKPEDKKCHLFLVDRSFLGNNPKKWVEEFRGKIQFDDNKEIPMVVLGYNSEINYILSLMVPGVSDYFVKPVDLLLLKHNSARLAGVNLEAEDKIYEIEANATVKILREAKVSRLSEFEMTGQVRAGFNPKELVEIFSDVFDVKSGDRILALCQSSEPDPNEKGLFNCRFSFVGLAPGTMNEIRKWLKRQYIGKKTKET